MQLDTPLSVGHRLSPGREVGNHLATELVAMHSKCGREDARLLDVAEAVEGEMLVRLGLQYPNSANPVVAGMPIAVLHHN